MTTQKFFMLYRSGKAPYQVVIRVYADAPSSWHAQRMLEGQYGRENLIGLAHPA